MAREKPNSEVTDEDVEAEAYFPKAKDWLDIGRRRLRWQLKRLEDRLLKEFGKRLSYPLETEEAWYMVRALGYRAERKNLDYCLRHEHMAAPKRDGKRFLWTRENVIEYAMQLERLRYWVVGRHDEKKTVWELQAEWDQMAPAYDADLNRIIDSLDAEGLLELMVTTANDAQFVRRHIADYYHLRRWQRGERLDATDEELLSQLVEEEDAEARKAVATTIQRRADKEAST